MNIISLWSMLPWIQGRSYCRGGLLESPVTLFAVWACTVFSLTRSSILFGGLWESESSLAAEPSLIQSSECFRTVPCIVFEYSDSLNANCGKTCFLIIQLTLTERWGRKQQADRRQDDQSTSAPTHTQLLVCSEQLFNDCSVIARVSRVSSPNRLCELVVVVATIDQEVDTHTLWIYYSVV